jgi:endo-1,4-beta-D-glucanase Y
MGSGQGGAASGGSPADSKTGGGGSAASDGRAGTGGTIAPSGGGPSGGKPATGGTGGREPAGHPGPPYTFPQNNRSQYCIYPSGAYSGDARTTYGQWKTELVTTNGAGGYRRVQRPDNENNTTVSEGIGYGMLLAVTLDDQALFDDLYRYSQLHLNANGLMIWLVDQNGSSGTESGSATDGDEDMAWALALAAQKWGGGGSLTADYLTLAKTQINRIWQYEADHSGINLINAGDSWGTTFAWNPSYFAPNEYRRFGQLTGDTAGWQAIIDAGYQTLARSQNASSGLVPAWTDRYGTPTTPAYTSFPTHYQYDAARVPFRIGLDYCDYGDARAQTILAKLSGFFSGIGAANIVDGYNLDGSARPEHTTPAGVQSALFVGAAGVGAMSSAQYQAFLDQTYTRLVTQPDTLMLPPSYYFNLSWKVFSLSMMSGNLFEYALRP